MCNNYRVRRSFSYELISDGNEHRVELLAQKQNFTLRVDGGVARSVVNDGEHTSLQTGDQPLYLGGVPVELGRHALDLWHLRNSTSFRGKEGIKNILHFIVRFVLTRASFVPNFICLNCTL